MVLIASLAPRAQCQAGPHAGPLRTLVEAGLRFGDQHLVVSRSGVQGPRDWAGRSPLGWLLGPSRFA